jgi:hypothetical protein
MKYGSETVGAAIRKVRAYQGMPLPNLAPNSSIEDQIVVEAMAAGLLPSPQVESFKGVKRFAFTPYQGQGPLALDPTERAILQKARAVLACIRYGQHFGSITSIQDPMAIINALITRGRIGPHSEIAKQYSMLVVENVARISRDAMFSSRYYLELIDTEENQKALRLASDMLAVGEVISDRGLDAGARDMLFAGGQLKEPATVRAEEITRRMRQPAFSPAVLRKEFELLIDEIRRV